MSLKTDNRQQLCTECCLTPLCAIFTNNAIRITCPLTRDIPNSYAETIDLI